MDKISVHLEASLVIYRHVSIRFAIFFDESRARLWGYALRQLPGDLVRAGFGDMKNGLIAASIVIGVASIFLLRSWSGAAGAADANGTKQASVLNGRSDPASTSSSGDDSSSVSPEGLVGADGEEHTQLHLLDQLATENEVFKWAVEQERKSGNTQANGVVFSKPETADFRKWFDSNETEQTWEKYVYWVETFYKGNYVSQGWVKTGEEFIAKSDHPASLRYVNVLGRVLVSEWAKHRKVRKIGNMDVYRWGRDLDSGKLSLEQLSRVLCDRLNGAEPQ